ncbi:conserved hypothetical protein [Flavobacterium sp. 9AF]|uniref:hypothetical protein n=1 Tax=Flavobacterium sp. 9AF TaxID=2653142 RepID=UPI0012F23309|nr:hypothetical protein [Flavobacterium sp. 9AF]VXC23993.1 conserved hypothetical protein [Flavobacterium sp. 9AF]
MRKIFFSLFFLILLSCSEKKDNIDLKFLNGIWEIQKVVLTDNSVKEYKINESVEQININKNKGTRRKVLLFYNGNFVLNNIIQEFRMEQKDKKYFLLNHTQFSEWKEVIETLNDSELVLKNEQGLEYHYKKRTDIKLGEDGKEI